MKVGSLVLVGIVAALVAALVAVLFAGTRSCHSDASASCAGPYLDDQPPGGEFGAPAPTVAAGESVTIYGHFYSSTCNDTGCDSPLKPLPDVHLIARLPGGTDLDLGSFTPGGKDMGFHATVTVPADTPDGTAILSDDGDFGATAYRFTVGSTA
ncbi:MAG: hypothetical protein QM572_11075 [Nocardioides sp.]|uniref:hypothetical protein n=1 Tax=Nocardioides sp. TaxID=35761 RepID=UPI0039E48168